MTYVSAALRRLVRKRAREVCEYCLVPEAVSFASHQVDHVIAHKHGGVTAEDNLALSCALCNKRKGSDLVSLDPDTGLMARLYDPRRQRWREHFGIEHGSITPLTHTGRATTWLLQLNHPERVAERVLLIAAEMIRPG